MIKKLLSIITVFTCFVMAGLSQAEEQKNYHLQTELTGPSSYADKFKIKPSDAPHGIYIIAWSGMKSIHANVADLIKDKFRANGFVIADKLEDADLGINFGGIALPFDDIDDKVTHLNKENVAVHIGAAVLTGGISLISSGISLMGKAKGQASISGDVYKTPLKTNWRGRVDSESGRNTGIAGVKFSADEVNADVYLSLFALALDEWMKEYTESDTTAVSTAKPALVNEAVQPVSAPAAAK